MAKDKNSFILYSDLIHTIERLSDENAGQLFKHLMRYVNDQDPVCDNLLLEIAFEPIKHQLKRDLHKFEQTKERRSIAGKIGAEKRWQEMANDSNRIQSHTKDSNRIQTMANNSNEWQAMAKMAVNDNDNVNVNDINNSNVDFQSILAHFNSTFQKRCTVFSTSAKNKYRARFKEGYTIDMVKQAMVAASKSKHHLESNFKYCTLEFFSRAEKLDMYATATSNEPKPYNPRA